MRGIMYVVNGYKSEGGGGPSFTFPLTTTDIPAVVQRVGPLVTVKGPVVWELAVSSHCLAALAGVCRVSSFGNE